MARRMKMAKEKLVMLDALSKCNGIVTIACEASKTIRQTHYRWIKQDAEYAARVEEINEACIDFVEDKCYSLISQGDPTLIKFYLSTKGRSRGFTQKSEVELSGKVESIVSLAQALNGLPKA